MERIHQCLAICLFASRGNAPAGGSTLISVVGFVLALLLLVSIVAASMLSRALRLLASVHVTLSSAGAEVAPASDDLGGEALPASAISVPVVEVRPTLLPSAAGMVDPFKVGASVGAEDRT